MPLNLPLPCPQTGDLMYTTISGACTKVQVVACDPSHKNEKASSSTTETTTTTTIITNDYTTTCNIHGAKNEKNIVKKK